MNMVDKLQDYSRETLRDFSFIPNRSYLISLIRGGSESRSQLQKNRVHDRNFRKEIHLY
jgi:hypothetical protein